MRPTLSPRLNKHEQTRASPTQQKLPEPKIEKPNPPNPPRPNNGMAEVDAKRLADKRRREEQLKRDNQFGTNLNDQNEMMGAFERGYF